MSFVPPGYRYVSFGPCRQLGCDSPEERLVVRLDEESLGPAAWYCLACVRRRIAGGPR